MGLMDNLGLGNAVDNVTGQPSNSGAGRFRDITEDDFENTYGDNLQAGTWRTLAEYIVEAQNRYNVGFGVATVPDKVGRWYMVLDDGSGNLVTGEARLKTMNSNDEQVETEQRAVPTSRLNTDPNDFRKQFALPENQNTLSVGEDSKIVLQFRLNSSSAGTSVDFSADATDINIPSTNYS